MSKSSTATAPKIPTQLPAQSAWSRGPPQGTSSTSAPSPRSQSPAPNQGPPAPTHSRRPSTLSQGVSFRDGVATARSPTSTIKQGPSVTFGSIDDAAAPISSSPAAAPAPIKADSVKSFGTVPATPTSASVNGKSTPTAASGSSQPPTTPSTPSKFDIKKLFQTPSSTAPALSPAPSQSAADAVSPSNRPAPLPHPSPQASHSQPQPPQLGPHAYPTFIPGALRPPIPQNGAPTSPNGPPRSPVYSRQMPNGQVNGVNGRPSGAPGGPGGGPGGMPAGMSSPRMGPPHAGQPTMQAPPVPVNWGYYYPYPGLPHDAYMPYSPGWPVPPHVVPQPHQQPQGPPGPPHPGMPLSPRNAPPPLHPPGTPTLTPAVPPTGHAPHTTPSPHTHPVSLSSVSSPPPTPSTSTSGGALNRSASAFVPQQRKLVKITKPDGNEVVLDSFRKHGASASVATQPPTAPSSPMARRTTLVRMEAPEAREKRLADEEKAKREAEEKERKEKEAKARKEREEEERKRTEEERLRKEKEEKEARLKREEEERIRKVEEEKERLRKEEEKREQERLRKEEEEKERIRKEEEEKERLRKEEEERERLRKEEEERERERAAKEAEEAAAAAAAAAAAKAAEEAAKAEAEEGEVAEQEESKPASEPSEEPSTEDAKDKSQDKPLRIDTAVSNPDIAKRRPGRLDLSSTRNQNISQPLPSALATARVIEDINSISYPDGIKSPSVELNANAKQGKFRYDRDFLLQFMAVCKEKPDSLPPLDAIGLEPSDQSFTMSRGGSGRRSSSAMMPPPSTTRPGVHGLGITVNKSGMGGFPMGQFGTAKSSEERFAMSNSSRPSSMSGGPALNFGRPAPMVRSSSQGGAGAMSNKRTRSKRGVDRAEANKTGAGPSSSAFGSMSQGGMAPLEPVEPLKISESRWQPASLGRKPPPADTESPEIVDRKVKGLLNKLTMERFDSISDQIIAWANKSEKEKDGRTLIQVIRLVFEKATDEATWSEMYARLCRKMMEQISTKVQDDGIKNNEGKPIAGGQLFRKYLLNRCQEDFERGWVAKEATAAAAATKATEDQAAKAAAEKGSNTDESALYSDEYYAAQKAKRQGLGLIKFIGELFKLQMLTERIMHECIKKLLGNVDNPEEEEIESLCKLMTTVGKLLDTPKARAHMDVYFSRMKELCKNPNVNSRMQFMLQDVIELRDRQWVPRKAVAAPTTIAAVHEAAAKEKSSESQAYQRNLNMSRGGSRRGDNRGDHTQVGPDGWAVAGNTPRAPPKAGDLSNFGKIQKTTSMTFGPTSVFAGKDKSKSRESTLGRTGSMNMFSKLMDNPELASDVANAKSSRPPSRKASVDLGSGGAPEPQRRKLNLLPRTVPKPDESKADSTPAESEANSEDEDEEASSVPSLTEEEAKTRVVEDSKEFFSIRDLGEAEVYFTKLPSEHRFRLVDKLVSYAIESKEVDAQLVADFFSRAASKNLCSPQSFEDGFAPVAEILDDIAIDAPKAFNLMATMMKGARLDSDEARCTRLASKSMDSDKLLGLLS
ncbi:hypothetical protein WOLCODRAFT_27969 [Wolfiporia cocos MD-104 SS10]|uniref:MI domain-containing protein n=1 Tax=Wolfiporia cocos (strain MD-104) TaxID=742152 RepID=A0A2H3JHR4_WOLCO|nr:hypothetical protein WOLCODRAFT_27969 [Wolfiporia cocos MD-104 SS10]